ncbi:MAG: sulfotransferase [Candidatus Latescibacterota bacterium]
MSKQRKSILRPVRRAYEDIKTRLQGAGAEVHPRPVFILGNQKSGTSPIAGLLAEMTGIPLTMDIRREIERPRIEFIRQGELALSDYIKENKLDFSRAIIKEPNLTFIYQQLDELYGEAKIVFVYRDPRDNIRSILNRVEVSGRQKELTDVQKNNMTIGWRKIFEGEPVGRKGEDYIDTMALRWDCAARILLDNEKRFVTVRFEDFLQDKIGAISRLARDLDLADTHDISGQVDHPFQPPGDRSVSWIDFFGERNLRRIESVCGGSMARLNYKKTAGPE